MSSSGGASWEDGRGEGIVLMRRWEGVCEVGSWVGGEAGWVS